MGVGKIHKLNGFEGPINRINDSRKILFRSHQSWFSPQIIISILFLCIAYTENSAYSLSTKSFESIQTLYSVQSLYSSFHVRVVNNKRKSLLYSIPFHSKKEIINHPNTNVNSDQDTVTTKRIFLGKGLNQHDKSMIQHWSRQTISIGIPALLGMMADPILSLIDTAYVGKLGSIELAALGTCTSIFHFAFNAFRATTTVTTSLVATAIAASTSSSKIDEKDKDTSLYETEQSTTNSSDNPVNENIRSIIRSSIQYGLINGLLLAIGLFQYGTAALHVMGIPSSSTLYKPGHTYLQIRSLAAPAVLFLGVAEGAFRGFTDTTIPLMASLLATVTNIILNPILMFSMKMGVGGAAAATVISQYAAAILYGIFLFKRKMILNSRLQFCKDTSSTKIGSTHREKGNISSTIFWANLSMMAKQGSLLFAWTFATACATRLGHEHVAAHQIALSLWLFFVLIIDGAVVSAQILMSKAYGAFLRESESHVMPEYSTNKNAHVASSRRDMKTLTCFMTLVAIVQGSLSMGSILWFGKYAPNMFTTDIHVKGHLMALIPHLAWQQVLISLVLVLESLIVGANQFELLALGTTFSTLIAMKNIRDATTIVSIWSHGIVSLFVGRLITAVIGILKINGFFSRLTIKHNVLKY